MFEDCTSLKSVIIPDNVTSIEAGAFKSCTGLTTITSKAQTPPTIVSETVEYTYATFEGVTVGNVTLKVPAGTKEAYSSDDSGWKDFKIEEQPITTESDGVTIYYQYTDEGKTALKVVKGEISYGDGAITIPATVSVGGSAVPVTAIGEAAFLSKVSLTSVTIQGDKLTTIGAEAFKGCSILNSIEIPNSVTSIGAEAFYKCPYLTSVAIGDNVTTIGKHAFYECERLSTLTLGSGVTEIGEAAFGSCKGLSGTVTIPSGVTSISKNVFNSCESLTSVIFKGEVTTIGASAFNGCTSLYDITIPSSVTIIDDAAFASCTGLESITIPSSVTTIGESVFYNCSYLETVTMLGETPPTLGGNAFTKCDYLESIYVPYGKSTDYKAAANWITYKDKIKESEAASKEVTEGDVKYKVTGGKATVTGFAAEASDKTTLTIPATIESGSTTVTAIGENAFNGCTTLTSVTVLATELLTVGTDAFNGCSNLTTIYVPDGKVDAYRAADGWSGFKYIASTTDEGLTVNDGSATITYKYTDNNKTALKVVSGTNKYTGTVTIPEKVTYNGTELPVTAIGDMAFYECTGITSVTIPSSVKTIDMYAFAGCSKLTSIEIPSGVTSIGENAFWQCTALKTVDIPSSVTSIGEEAFAYCTGLEGTVTIPKGVTSIGVRAFIDCAKLTGVTISEGVKEIGGTAFYGTGLTEVTIPSSVTKIGNTAFGYCSSLSTITIQSGVTSIGEDAFASCKKLTEVTIPSSVTSIGDGAFGDCTALTKVTSNIQTPFAINSNVFDSSVKSSATLYVPAWTQSAYKAAEGWKEFTNIEELADTSERETTDGGLKFTIANKKATVTGFASDASDKTTISIPATVTYSGTACDVTGIGAGAFKNETSLKSVTVLATVPLTVGANAFSGCSNLETLYVPNDEAVSKYRDAEGWKDIKYIATTTDDGLKVNDGSVTITYKYTDGKKALEVVNVDPAKGDITIPAEIGGLPVTAIGNNAFQGCTGLTSVTIKGNNLKTIGTEAFRKCTGLKTVTIPSSVTSIGDKAFCECAGLEGTVTIPSGVTVIGESVFGGCAKLTGVTIPEGVTSIGDGAFGYCSSLSTITIPSGVTTIGEAAFAGCTGLTSVTIPSGVTSIGASAFAGCTALTKVTSNIEKPFAIGSDVFDEDVKTSATLIVPKGTKETYAAAEGWKEFTTIDDGTTGDGDNDDDDDDDDSILTYKQVSGGLEVSGITSGYSGSIVIPETASINGGDAQNVISIGASAFKDCTGLTSVTIPSSVTNIDAYAFAGCTGIKNITVLTTTPPSLGDDVFESTVKANATLKVPADTKVKYAAADGWKAFARIVEDKTGPDYIEEEEDGTVINFNYNTGDTGDKTEWYVTKGNYTGTVTIPEKVGDLPVTGIESEAFAGCTGLEAVEIPRSVTTIGDGAFDGCSALETVTIHSTVTTIGAGAFDGCTTLKKVIAEDIPAWCSINFGSETANPLVQAGHIYSDENTEITDLVISERVKTIGKYAFAGGIGLRSVTIGSNNNLKSDLKVEEYYEGVKEIGDSAFYGCSNLISVTLRNSVETIGAYAFNDCNMLDSITIPSGVKAIGEKAFYCSDISKVVSHIEEPFAIEASAFSNYTLNDGTLYVPDETLTKYKSTAGRKEFRHIVGKMSTGIEDIAGEKVTIQANSGALHIDGVKDGARVVVYSLTGAMIGSGNVTGGSAIIPTGLRRGDIAIVRIGSTAVKVMVQ